MNRTCKSKPFIITWPKFTVLIHWGVVYAVLLTCWKTPRFITLRSSTQRFYLPELYAIVTHCLRILYSITLLSNSQILKHCWAIRNPEKLLRYTQLFYIADVNCNSLHCRAAPSPDTFLRCTQSQHVVEVSPILLHCWAITYLSTLSNYDNFYILLSVFAKRCRQPMRMEYNVNGSTIKKWCK